MRATTFAILAGFASVANAHFRLLFPEPRGPFVDDIEPEFCGGYTETTTNRSTFPLTGGFVTISTNHPSFVAGIIVSTAQNTISFNNFSSNGKQQIIRPFGAEPAAGSFCLPVDFSLPQLPAITDGANVTLQIVYDGGDGMLYQCADLTLRRDFTIDSGTTCTNSTSDGHHDDDEDEDEEGHSHAESATSSSSATSSAGAAAPSSTGNAAISSIIASGWLPSVLGALGVALLAI